MNNPLIIFGSARSKGYTSQAIEEILNGQNVEIIDLNTLNITPYDYEHRNQADDYLPLMKKIVTHDIIILATPIYWYSTSAQIKIFLDRLTDLLDYAKDIGRQLRGKKLFVISTYHSSIPKGFEDTFVQICQYMGIKYEGTSFICTGNNPELLKLNPQEIAKARKIICG